MRARDMIEPAFKYEIVRPIGYRPDSEYQMRAVRIYLALVRDKALDVPETVRRNLSLAWESALFLGDY